MAAAVPSFSFRIGTGARVEVIEDCAFDSF